MLKRIIGVVLFIAGCAAALVLLRAGRFILPHVLGPAALAIVGLALVTTRKRT